jgi:hypothetical protein
VAGLIGGAIVGVAIGLLARRHPRAFEGSKFAAGTTALYFAIGVFFIAIGVVAFGLIVCGFGVAFLVVWRVTRGTAAFRRRAMTGLLLVMMSAATFSLVVSEGNPLWLVLLIVLIVRIVMTERGHHRRDG